MEYMIRYFARSLRSRKGQAGFTLIELLVVVTILGVLAAIVTLSLVGLTTNAQAKACEQEYKTVQAGLDAYMANNNVDTVARDGRQRHERHDQPGAAVQLARRYPDVPPQLADAVGVRVGRALAGSPTSQPAAGGPAVPPGCVVSGG